MRCRKAARIESLSPATPWFRVPPPVRPPPEFEPPRGQVTGRWCAHRPPAAHGALRGGASPWRRFAWSTARNRATFLGTSAQTNLSKTKPISKNRFRVDESAAYLRPLLRIRIPTPPTIAGQADVHAGHLRTPVHYEFAASFAARQIRQLTPSGTIGGSSALLTPRHTTYYPHQLLHHQLNLSRAAGRGEEDTEQQLLDRLFADAPALRPSGGLTPAAIAALERNLTPDEGSCCAICLELLHSFLPEQQSSADPPPHLPSPSPPPQSPQPEVEQAEGGALSASAVATGSTVKLPCGHEFHDGCVRRWLSSHSTCPVCRHELACS